MKLKTIYKQSRCVAAPTLGETPFVLEELANVPANMSASATGMYALFRRYSENGRHSLTTDLFHEVDAKYGVWEFIKGRLRVLCFVSPDDGSLLVLSHCFIKKSQKTPAAEINRAIRVIEEYQLAQKTGCLILE